MVEGGSGRGMFVSGLVLDSPKQSSKGFSKLQSLYNPKSRPETKATNEASVTLEPTLFWLSTPIQKRLTLSLWLAFYAPKKGSGLPTGPEENVLGPRCPVSCVVEDPRRPLVQTLNCIGIGRVSMI